MLCSLDIDNVKFLLCATVSRSPSNAGTGCQGMAQDMLVTAMLVPWRLVEAQRCRQLLQQHLG